MKTLASAIGLWLAALAAWLPTPARAQDVAAAQLQQLAAEDLQSIGQEWHLAPRLSFSDDGPIELRPDTGLSLGRARLLRYLATAPAQWRRDALRWIIAHETWHQVQFARGGGAMPERGSAGRRFAECEADVMAGWYVVKARGGDVNPQWGGAGAILDVARQVAQENAGAADYPGPAQRNMAIQTGIRRGLLPYVERFAPAGEGIEALPWLQRITDFRAQEGEQPWASRQCRRILHLDPAIANLIRGHAEIAWSDNPPRVSFRIPFRNVGATTLAVSMEIDSVSFLRGASEDFGNWLTTDARNWEFQLAPQGIYEVAGALVAVATAERGRRLIYPMDENSLISVRELAAPQERPAEALVPDGLSPREIALGAALDRIAGEAGRRFAAILSTRCSAGGGANSCASLVAVPNAQDSEIVTEADGGVSFVATLCDRCTETDATALYNRFAADLRHIYAFKPIREHSVERAIRVEIRIRPSVKLVLTRYNGTSGYLVDITIEPVFFE